MVRVGNGTKSFNLHRKEIFETAMRYILFTAFIVVPVLEITLFLKVGSLIGIPATIGLILLTAIVGTMLVRSQGLEVLTKIRRSAERGEAPVEALVQGACVLAAGLLLLTPGFATDTIGFALLIPPVRSFMVGKVWKMIEPHVVTTTVHETRWRQERPSSHGPGQVIEGEAVEVDEESSVRGRNRDH
jgi:UPF0716 protein FxsA